MTRKKQPTAAATAPAKRARTTAPATAEATAPVTTDEAALETATGTATPPEGEATNAEGTPGQPASSEAATVAEVQPEVPFGEDPEDLAGADSDDVPGTPEPTTGATATYHGLQQPTNIHPVAITVIVPDPPRGYAGVVTEGTTYTFARDVPRYVDQAHARWLAKHPHYDISVATD